MGTTMSEAEELAIADHLVVYYWLEGWGVVIDERGQPRQKAVRKSGPLERRARATLGEMLRNSRVEGTRKVNGAFLKLAEFIDPPAPFMPSLEINRRQRGGQKDEMQAHRIHRFIQKQMASGLNLSRAKEAAMLEFSVEKTTIEKQLKWIKQGGNPRTIALAKFKMARNIP